jgi:hypothetical protein
MEQSSKMEICLLGGHYLENKNNKKAVHYMNNRVILS